MGNCSQINNTTILGTSAVTYDSTPLPCTDVNTCDGLNTVLSKFDTIICNVKESVDILTEQVIDITEDLMIITEDIININNQLNICCPTCDFTGTADQLPDPTTTTTSSSSTSTSTTTSSSSTTSTTSSTTTVPPTSTTTSTSSSTSTSTSTTSTSTSSTTSSTTTTSTTVNPFGQFGVSNQSGGLIAGTWTIFINSVPYNDFSTGFASIPNNTSVLLPMNNNFNPPRTGTFKIVFTPGSGMSISRQATLTGGSSVGPVNFILNAGNYEATINVTTPNAQLGYSIQIT